MVEFQITAAYVLIPLFLIIPLLAKYIDIKHAGINAVRYQAWEYTAWYNRADSHGIVKNFTSNSVPYKSPGVTGNEAQRRFLSTIREKGHGEIKIKYTDLSGYKTADRNSLWTNHVGTDLFAGRTRVQESISTGNNTPGFTLAGFKTTSITDTVLKVFGLLFRAFGKLLGFVDSSAEFTAWQDMEGYTTTLGIPVRTYPNMIEVYEAPVVESFQSRAGVLSETWNSGGTVHTYEQVGGAVPTTLFNQILTTVPFSLVWNVIEFMAPEMTLCQNPAPLIPSLAAKTGLIDKDGSLWLGYIDSDTVHPDRLRVPGSTNPGGTHVCDASGRCRLQPNFTMSHSRCRR